MEHVGSFLMQNVLAADNYSAKTWLMLGAVGFLSSLLNNPSHKVSFFPRLCARDVRSTLGSNIS